jgi:hypothetical protein
MLRESVDSSNLVSVGYDPTTMILEVEFKAGTVYEYANVPLEIYTQLMSAVSKGSYHYRNIRMSFPYKKIQ